MTVEHRIKPISITSEFFSEEKLKDIEKNPNVQDWWTMSYNFYLSENFIRRYKDYIFWDILCLCQNLSKEFIIEFADKINFQKLLYNPNLSQEIKDYCRMFI